MLSAASAHQQDAREVAKVAKKKEKEAKEQEVYEKILARQEEIRKLQDAIVADRETLAQEELEQQEARKVKDRDLVIVRMKQEMIVANEMQKAFKVKRLASVCFPMRVHVNFKISNSFS